MLQNRKVLQKFELAFPRKKVIRYIKSQASPYELALSFDENAYFEPPYGSLSRDGLTDREPKNIFLNSEQSPKRPKDFKLLQENMEIAL